MKGLKFISIVLPALLVCLGACNTVHEFPDPEYAVDPTDISSEVEVQCQIELNVEKIVTKGSLSPIYPDENNIDYLRRYNVNIFEETKSGKVIVFEDVLYQEVSDMNELTFHADLKARKYSILVWMDYVLKESKTDLHYKTTSGLNAITVQGVSDYKACDDFKDSQTILFPVDLTTSLEWFRRIVIDVPLQRPVAKVTFEATDFGEYVAKMGYVGTLEELIKNYRIHIIYNGYLATGFNAITQKMNDASVGYGFTSTPWMIEEPDISRLGFDYVFVNGDQSSLTVTVEILDKDGKLLNSVDGVLVPTYRGKETVVRMKFFTREYSPGIGINPEFDGEFNVYV